MNQNDKSEAQIRNEEIVHKIMAERGYGQAAISKKKHKKLPVKALALLGTLIIAVLVSVSIFSIQMNKNDSTNDNPPVSSLNKDGSSGDSGNESNNDENNINETEMDIEVGPNNDRDTQYNPPADSTSSNVYRAYNDNDGTQDYTDGSTFNPHHCDAIEKKYEDAKSDADALHLVWENAYKNQTSYSELYNKAGKDATLATKWMEEEQQVVADAQSKYQEAINKANSIYNNEVIPCHKEMYNQK